MGGDPGRSRWETGVGLEVQGQQREKRWQLLKKVKEQDHLKVPKKMVVYFKLEKIRIATCSH